MLVFVQLIYCGWRYGVFHRRRRSGCLQELVNQFGHALNEQSIHMIMNTHLLQHAFRFCRVSAPQPRLQLADPAIEVVIVNDENTLIRMTRVVLTEIAINLQTHGCFAGTLGSKDNRG